MLALGFTAGAQTAGLLPPPAFTQADLGSRIIPIAPETGYTANLPVLQRAATAGGHLDPAFDADGVVRRVPMVKRYGDGYYAAFSLATAAVAVEAKRIRPVFDANGDLEALDAGGLRVPVAHDGTALVPYRGAPGSYRAFAAADILHGQVRAGRVRGRDRAGRHEREGPAGPALDAAGAGLPRRRDPREPRVGHAGRRHAQRARAARARSSALVVLVAGLVAIFALPWRRPLASVAGIVALAAAVVGVALYFWFRQNAVVAVAPALVMLALLLVWNLIAGFLRERTRDARARRPVRRVRAARARRADAR